MKSKILAWLRDPKRTAQAGKMLFLEYGTNINITRLINRLQDDKRIIAILDVQLKQLIGVSVLPDQVDQPKKAPAKEQPNTRQSARKSNIQDIQDLRKSRRLPDRPASRPDDDQVKKQITKELADPYPIEKRPKELDPVYDSKNKLYVEAKNLHAQLVAKGDEMDKFQEDTKAWQKLADERKEIAKKLLELWNQVNDHWGIIDHFKKHGQLPLEEDSVEKKSQVKADDENPVELDKRWRTLGTYISKAKKKPEKNAEKLKEYLDERNDIAKKLNKLAGEEKYKITEYEAPKPKAKKTPKSRK